MQRHCGRCVSKAARRPVWPKGNEEGRVEEINSGGWQGSASVRTSAFYMWVYILMESGEWECF